MRPAPNPCSISFKWSVASVFSAPGLGQRMKKSARNAEEPSAVASARSVART